MELLPFLYWGAILLASSIAAILASIYAIDAPTWQERILPNWYDEKNLPIWPFQITSIALIAALWFVINNYSFDMFQPFTEIYWQVEYIIPSFIAFTAFCILMMMSAGNFVFGATISSILWLVIYALFNLFT